MQEMYNLTLHTPTDHERQKIYRFFHNSFFSSLLLGMRFVERINLFSFLQFLLLFCFFSLLLCFCFVPFFVSHTIFNGNFNAFSSQKETLQCSQTILGQIFSQFKQFKRSTHTTKISIAKKLSSAQFCPSITKLYFVLLCPVLMY